MTLSISGTTASGRSACNSYTGVVDTDGEQATFSGLGGTEMGCEPEVMALEAAYLGALAAVSTAENDAERVTLRGDGVELHFVAVLPVEPAPLTGTVWVLESLIASAGPDGSASTAVGARATLELGTDGAVVGSTGCREFDGRYVVHGATVELRDLAMSDDECEPDVAAQDDAVVTVLEDGFAAEVDGDQLTVSDPGRSALVYRAERRDGAAAPLDGWWLLEDARVDGGEVNLGQHRITLRLGGTIFDARAGCNWMSGTVRVDGSSVGLVDWTTTDMYCAERAPLESVYIEALRAVQSYERVTDSLVMRGPSATLTFRALLPVDLTTFVDRRWVLESLTDDGAPVEIVDEGGYVTFRADGTFDGLAGTCAYFGTYVVEGDRIRFTGQTLDEEACPPPDGPVADLVLAAFGGEFEPISEGDTLTIPGAGGVTAVYRDASAHG